MFSDSVGIADEHNGDFVFNRLIPFMQGLGRVLEINDVSSDDCTRDPRRWLQVLR